MSTIEHDGFGYASDSVVAEGREPVKLASNAPRLIIGIPIRDTINEITTQKSTIATTRTISPEFMFSLLQCVPPFNMVITYRVEKGQLGGPARDSIIRYAIEKNAKYIMFLDDDVLFPDYTISRMVQRMETNPDIGILTGVYCTNKMGFSEPLIFRSYGEGIFWNFELNEMYDIYACGAGCMMVRVEALKSLKPPWFFESLQKIGDSEAQTIIGHDVMVCRRMWEETGYRVAVDTGILCGHLDIHRGIIHILPRQSPPYRLSKHKHYIDLEISDGTVRWFEHKPEVQAEAASVGKTNNKKLLALTTCKDFERVKKAIESVQDKSWDIIVLDDGSPNANELSNFCRERNVGLLTKDRPMGVTSSWNMAYIAFKHNNYDVCCISNDDVLFAPNALKYMEEGLALNGFVAVGPTSNNPGHQPHQHIDKYIGQIDRKDVQAVEVELDKNVTSVERLSYLNGFCFMFDRRITNYEYSKDLLFDPRNVNVGNEDDLCMRLMRHRQKVGYTPKSYVWHEKAWICKGPDREKLWTEIEAMANTSNSNKTEVEATTPREAEIESKG